MTHCFTVICMHGGLLVRLEGFCVEWHCLATHPLLLRDNALLLWDLQVFGVSMSPWCVLRRRQSCSCCRRCSHCGCGIGSDDGDGDGDDGDDGGGGGGGASRPLAAPSQARLDMAAVGALGAVAIPPRVLCCRGGCGRSAAAQRLRCVVALLSGGMCGGGAG